MSCRTQRILVRANATQHPRHWQAAADLIGPQPKSLDWLAWDAIFQQ
jgi:hypothetical protein